MFFEACNIMNNKLVFLIRYVGNVERPFSFLSVILLLLFFLLIIIFLYRYLNMLFFGIFHRILIKFGQYIDTNYYMTCIRFKANVTR